MILLASIGVVRITPKRPEHNMKMCPFQAIEIDEKGYYYINENCRVCKMCLKFAPEYFFWQESNPSVERKGSIAVFLEWQNGAFHSVGYELIGKALSLAESLHDEVVAVVIGSQLNLLHSEIRNLPVQKVYIYDHADYSEYRIEPYKNALLDFIQNCKPNVLLIGATPLGRSLAPRVATACRTGLTADCTELQMKEDRKLIQIRPAFGGNIMAQIKTHKGTPQMATVRPHVMKALCTEVKGNPKLVYRCIDESSRASGIKMVQSRLKPIASDISQAETIIAIGRGVKSKEDCKVIFDLAEKLSAVVAYSRPLVEAGWGEPRFQIGLSGKSIQPKLLITLGISGSVQFSAGISGAEYIIAVNSDLNAPIFNQAHLGIVGDLYEIVPLLTECLTMKLGRYDHEEI